MSRFHVCLLLLLCAASSGFPAPARSGETPLNGHTFTLPQGFDIELVAGPPLVDRPITAAFDDEGRL